MFTISCRLSLAEFAVAEGHPSPGVKALRSELTILYQNCSVVMDDSVVHTDAWFVRKAVSFVKMKVRRRKVSTATHLHNYILFFWCQWSLKDVFQFMARMLNHIWSRNMCLPGTEVTKTNVVIKSNFPIFTPWVMSACWFAKLLRLLNMKVAMWPSKVIQFQDLCLVLNPFLEALWIVLWRWGLQGSLRNAETTIKPSTYLYRSLFSVYLFKHMFAFFHLHYGFDCLSIRT